MKLSIRSVFIFFLCKKKELEEVEQAFMGRISRTRYIQILNTRVYLSFYKFMKKISNKKDDLKGAGILSMANSGPNTLELCYFYRFINMK
jgi:hypothetical protein